MTRWTEAELDLFKSKRQRGTKPTAPLEFYLHIAVADVLVRWASPDWRWTHLPFGEYRTPATAGRLKRMGVTKGWADFIFVHESGKVCWLELKREGNDATQAQEELGEFLSKAGHGYICTSSFDTALNTLKFWGVVPDKIAGWGGSLTTKSRDAAPCATTGENAIE